jgi:type IV pilus assembly protein PilQ
LKVTAPPAEKATPEPGPEPTKVAATPATRLTSILATPIKENVVIDVKADGAITRYKSFSIRENPPRIVYDIYKLKSPYKAEQRIAVKSEPVRKVRHYGHPDKLRVVLETDKAYLSKYSARPIDDGLQIYVGQAPPPVRAKNPKAAEPLTAKLIPALATQPAGAKKNKSRGRE